MNTNKILVGGVVGGIVFFFLGWLIWGAILMDYMTANCNQCMARPMDQMIWWALILSNLAWGFVLAIIFDWSNTSGWMEGAKKGAIFGLVTCLALDLGYYSMTTMFSSMTAVIIDIVGMVVMVTIGGALIGWSMGMVSKK
jgi:hypothetical protein